MPYRLIVFDMDGVLIKEDSSWQVLHSYFHVNAMNNFRAYLEGKITYKEFMFLDTLLWLKKKEKNISKYEVAKALLKTSLTSDAKKAIAELKKLGLKTAIITSGIDILAEHVARTLNVDYFLANSLIFDEKGHLKAGGKPKVPLLDKDKVLSIWAKKNGFNLNEIIYVGDSVFDVPVFKRVGLSIAWTCNQSLGKNATIYLCCDELKCLVEIIEKYLKS